MQQNHTYSGPAEGDRVIDIKDIINRALSKWYWFVISVVLFLAIGYYFQSTRPRMYESSATVLLRQEQSAPEEMLLLQDLGFSAGKNNIDNEIGVFKSPDLITRIVASLELNTSYYTQKSFGVYPRELYKNSPLYVRMEGVEPDKIPGTTTLLFYPKKDGAYKVEAQYTLGGKREKEEITLSTLPGFIELSIGSFYVALEPSREFGSSPIGVTITNAAILARRIAEVLDISATSKQSTLLQINYRSQNRQRGEDFINALISEYNHEAIIDKNTVAYNTSIFIDERINDISLELGEVEGEVEQFRRKHDVTNIEIQADSYMRRNESYEARRMEIETQQNLVQYIEDFIHNPANRNKLIPNLGLKDPGLVELISEYNALLLNRERIEGASSPQNPALKQISLQVDNMYENIKVAIGNEKQGSQIALRDLEREFTITRSQISNIPSIERQYIDIIRQQEVKSNLFSFLLQKREETNLTQAAVAPKAKIVAKPFTHPNPVEPRKMIIMFAFLLLGVTLPAATLFAQDYFRSKIEGTSDLEKLKDVTLVGDIMESDEAIATKNPLVVKPADNSIIAEMFRTLRNNLLFMTTERVENIILVTSTIPSEGKTFISANLARSLSLMDKKTLLIGADLRNPQISRTINIQKRESGFSSYLAGHVKDYHQIIERVAPFFFVMQSGSIPPNPNEMLSRPDVKEMFDKLKEEFDYIVVDSAPVGVVSDTFLLASYANATLYVVRENYSKRDTIHFINNLVADGRLKNVGVVLNYTTYNSASAGYKYKYRYKYGYKYGYGNDN